MLNKSFLRLDDMELTLKLTNNNLKILCYKWTEFEGFVFNVEIK